VITAKQIAQRAVLKYARYTGKWVLLLFEVQEVMI
jgi:hypothetical protein